MFKLAWQNMIFQKSRALIACLTIVLSTVMVISVCSLAMTLHEMMLRSAIENFSDSHAKITGITTEQLGRLRTHQLVQDTSKIEWLRADVRLNLPETTEVKLTNMEGYLLELMPLTIGRYPQEINEVAVSGALLDQLNIPREPGQTVPIEFSVFSTESSATGYFAIEENLPRDFVLSGIIQDDTLAESTGGMLFSDALIQAGPPQARTEEALFRLNDNWDVKAAAQQVTNDIGAPADSLILNEAYVNAVGGSISFLLPFFVIAILMAASAFLAIYNIFQISVVSRVQQFGMLAAVGMTKKQKRRMVIQEGMFLALISIPIGLLIGWLFSYILIPHISSFFASTGIQGIPDLPGDAISASQSPVIFLVGTCISFLAVFAALRRPAAMASKTSPLEAIRFSGAVPPKKEKGRKSDKPIALFWLAVRNLSRNRRRTVLTALSIILSGTLFLVVASMVPTAQEMEGVALQMTVGDFQLMRTVQISEQGIEHGADEVFTQDDLKKIRDMPGVERIATLSYFDASTLDLEALLPSYMEIDDDDEPYVIRIIAADESFLQNCLSLSDDKKTSMEDLRTGETALLISPLEHRSALRPGDDFRVRIPGTGVAEQEASLSLGAWVDTRVPQYDFQYTTFSVIVHQSFFDRIGLKVPISSVLVYTEPDIDGALYTEIEATLKAFASENPVMYSSFREAAEEIRTQTSIMFMIFYCIVGMIFFIGMMNLSSTLLTTLLMRKKELGIMQAIGMTKRQLSRMLQLEGVLLGLGSTLVSAAAGSLLGWLAVTNISGRPFHFPVLETILLIGLTLVVQLAISTFTIRHVRHEPLIERFRYSG